MKAARRTLFRNVRPFVPGREVDELACVMVEGHHILAVVPARDVSTFDADATMVVDGAGATLLPGFIDAHFHLYQGLLELGVHWLREDLSIQEISASIRAYIRSHPAKTHYIVRGLSHGVFKSLEVPVRRFLDSLTADRPLILYSYDDHIAWANSIALERAGIARGMATRGNSCIVLDQDGYASGELRELDAYLPVQNILPPAAEVEVAAYATEGMRLISSCGISSVHNMNGNEEELAALQRLEESNALSVRVYCPRSIVPGDPTFPAQEAIRMRDSCKGRLVRSGAIKIFLDGIIEQQTASLLSPYCNAGGRCGEANYTRQQLQDLCRQADDLGLQLFIHSIGDGATRMALDVFASLRKEGGLIDSRPRLEHLEVVAPEDIGRFKSLGVVASLQPLHWQMASEDLEWQALLGPDRLKSIYPWRSLAESGVPVAFGSDWNVAPCSPLLGLTAALRRAGVLGTPQQNELLRRLLLHYTADAAYAEFEEQHKGKIAAGYLADLCLLDGDLFSQQREPASFKVALTMCDGRITHSVL
ncbi:MAG: amidohydrolase [Bdellovibrionota bacterium]|nr:MAG: amidohydrolase [Bdellovibrionota bacterium]